MSRLSLIASRIDGLTQHSHDTHDRIERLESKFEESSARQRDSIEQLERTIEERIQTRVADGVRVQYGGSVKARNIRDFMAHPEIDGALVGGASLDPEEFALIVRYR